MQLIHEYSGMYGRETLGFCLFVFHSFFFHVNIIKEFYDDCIQGRVAQGMSNVDLKDMVLSYTGRGPLVFGI